MRAVSDTSPLSNLAAIGRLSLLQSQFSEIWIPPAVRQELDAHPDSAALTAIQAALGEGWIRCASPAASPLLNVLLMHLHRGEAEAIALAADLKADVVIIDEQEGRELAAHAGLYVTGVLGILLRAKRNGHIPALEPEIQALRAKARFFIRASLEAKVLAAAGDPQLGGLTPTGDSNDLAGSPSPTDSRFVHSSNSSLGGRREEMLTSGMWKPDRIYGVDFSGAQDACKKIWIAEAQANAGALKVVSCKPIREMMTGRRDLAACLEALRELIAKPENARCAFGLDFPFGVPRPLATHAPTWEAWLEHFATEYGSRSADEFRYNGHRVALEKRLGCKEPARRTDLEAKAPLRTHNLYLYKQTFYGIRDVLSPLITSGKARVVPMQDRDPGAATLFEVCPACTVKILRLEVEGSKGDRGYRDNLLSKLEAAHCIDRITDTACRERILEDSEADGLDSVVAAIAVFRALPLGQTLAPRRSPYWIDYAIEGFIYQ